MVPPEFILEQSRDRFEKAKDAIGRTEQAIRDRRIEEVNDPEQLAKRKRMLEKALKKKAGGVERPDAGRGHRSPPPTPPTARNAGAAATPASPTRTDDAREVAPLAPMETFVSAYERVIGKNNLIPISYLDSAAAAAAAVGRVIIKSGAATTGYGTAFLVAPRLILTNHHVLQSDKIAAGCRVQFNFQDDAAGRPKIWQTFDLDPDALFLNDATLDYALVAVKEVNDDGGVLAQFGFNRLSGIEGKVIKGELLNIIQHPNGEPKQLAIRENQLVDIQENFLWYETDTSPGSSGSPVFNDQWQVVALHHSGVPERNAAGQVMKRDGTPAAANTPDYDIKWVANEGVRISRILTHVRGRPLPAGQVALRDTMFDAEPVPAGSPPKPDEINAGPASLADNRRGLQSAPADPPPAPLTPTVTNGTAVWTIPLRVSVEVGVSQVSSATPVQAVPVAPSAPIPAPPPPPPRRPGDTPTSSRPAPADADELKALLEHVAAARKSTYYDTAADGRDRKSYYRDIKPAAPPAGLFDALTELLTITHKNALPYRPHRYLYNLVDLRIDGRLQSIYTGETYDAEALIRESFALEQGQAELRRGAAESAMSAEALSVLEASLPYNCEHSVPKSWFGVRMPMVGDLHHLFTCESKCNSFRNNWPYGDFGTYDEAVRDGCGERRDDQFEPVHGKGVVARAAFYFLLRYPGEIANDARHYTPASIDMFRQWHKDEPVTDYERHRNAAIRDKQGNRNPLIDFPDWADRIDFAKGLG